MPEDMLRFTISGGAAGLAVDVGLYPLDTIETRLQAAEGFMAAGGFRHLYRGLGSIALGAVPSYALFFCTYEKLKEVTGSKGAVGEALCATAGELISLLVVNPVEIIKQRAQAGRAHTLSAITKDIWAKHGLHGFYRGYFSLAAITVPFTFIQIPVWEALKREIQIVTKKDKCTPLESALSGMCGGCLASIFTMPMDVAKTRIMLSDSDMTLGQTMIQIRKNEGFSKLFAGVLPRTVYVAVGGFVFFTAYEYTLEFSKEWFTS
uniref:S-adenosylmethionine mitochondrial carrier protein n=1 Tax=Panagrellus redivivus TaxID=6233 RepID=A0A7E4V2X5_PANRE